MPRESSLCKRCQTLEITDCIMDCIEDDSSIQNWDPTYDIPQLLLRLEVQDVSPDFPKLKASAESGCGFCSLLRHVLLEFPQSSTKRIFTINQFRYIRDDPRIMGFDRGTNIVTLAAFVSSSAGITRASKGASNDGVLHIPDIEVSEMLWLALNTDDSEFLPPRGATLLMCVLKHQDAVKRHPRLGRKPVAPSPLSIANTSMILDWIMDCDQHEKCRSQSSKYIPTRLIDVGDIEQGRSPSLVITSSKNDSKHETIRYAALSYCWGQPQDGLQQHLKTTPLDFEEHINGINPDRLPTTLRHAITATQKLGIRYLWIDALCIIQDEPDYADWLKESLMMKEIYGNAYLTLAPISSMSSFDGFLSPRHDLPSARIPFHSSRVPEKNGIFHLVPERSMNGAELHTEASRSVWSTRGWTLQEQMMSRRTLFFGSSTLHFCCQTGSRSENRYDPALPQVAMDWHRETKLSERPEFDESGQISLSKDYDGWYQMSWLLSSRKFTNYRDVLPAISGFAKSFLRKLEASGLSDFYIAGLWAKDLARGLCWQTLETSTDPLPRIPTPYFKPSWSWTSHPCRVEWDYTGFDMISYPPRRSTVSKCIIKIEPSRLQQNSFGLVSDVYLTITAKLHPIDAIIRAKNLNPNRIGVWYDAIFENVAIAECQLDFRLDDLLGWQEELKLSMLLVGESHPIEDSEQFYIDSNFDALGGRWLTGIILAIDPTERSKYLRVGFFLIKGTSSLFDDVDERTVTIA